MAPCASWFSPGDLVQTVCKISWAPICSNCLVAIVLLDAKCCINSNAEASTCSPLSGIFSRPAIGKGTNYIKAKLRMLC
jgi:hypothetical protein